LALPSPTKVSLPEPPITVSTSEPMLSAPLGPSPAQSSAVIVTAWLSG
jgi:hypothetical protein